MLPIQTFDARAGGNVLYKALAHPLAAEGMLRLAAKLGAAPVAIYDPDGVTDALLALSPGLPCPSEIYVSDVDQLGRTRAGLVTRPLTELARYPGERAADCCFRCGANQGPHRAARARGRFPCSRSTRRACRIAC